MQTVGETDAFRRSAKKAGLADPEIASLISFLSANPNAGVSLGGFLRKARIARPGEGRRGGYRVYFVNGGDDIPLYLLLVFAKNQKDDLTEKEKQKVVEFAGQIIEDYRKRRQSHG